MKAYLTLCFYESPAAMPHIKMWEKLMEQQKRIVYKEVNEETHHISYLVKRDDDIEALICSPVDDLKHQKFLLSELGKSVGAGIVALIRKQTDQEVESVQYLKTLIFGKVEQSQLQYISEVIKSFE